MGPSTARHGPIPPGPMLARSVVFLPRFLGAFPKALSPLGARARSGASPTFVPHSSTKTSLRGSSRATRLLQALLAPSSRSEAPTVFACRSTRAGGSRGSWSRPKPAPPAHAPTARGALRASPRRSPRAGATGLAAPRRCAGCSASCPARPRRHLPGLAPTPQPAPDGRHRHPEQAHDLLPPLAPVDDGEHPYPQVLRVRVHGGSIARRSLVLQTAVEPLHLNHHPSPRGVLRRLLDVLVDATNTSCCTIKSNKNAAEGRA